MAIAEPLQQVRNRTTEASSPETGLASKPDEDATSNSPSLLRRLLTFALVGFSVAGRNNGVCEGLPDDLR